MAQATGCADWAAKLHLVELVYVPVLYAAIRMWARGAELFEWLALKVNGDLGEEIVVIAEKE